MTLMHLSHTAFKTINEQTFPLCYYCESRILRHICQFSKISSYTHAAFTSILDVLGHPAPSWMSVWNVLELSALFSETITIHLYKPAVNLIRGNMLYPRIRQWTSPCNHVSSVVAITHQHAHEQHLTDWILFHLLRVTPTTSVASYQKNKTLV